MAKFQIALGAEIEAVTGNELNSALGDLRKELMQTGQRKKIFRPLSNAYTVPAMVSGDQFVVNLGQPAVGRVWTVTRITVIGDNDHQMVTNLAGSLYIGQGAGPSPGQNEVTQFQCVLNGQQIPFTSTQNENAWIVHDREQLSVLLRAFGPVTSTDIFITGQAWEYRDVDIEQQVI